MAFPVDTAMVKRAEEKLGRKLPLGYVKKMCQHNGGEVATDPDCWQLFPIFDGSDKKRLKRTCSDVVRETKVARKSRFEFPTDALVIGENGGGDLLVLMADQASDRYADAVYRWDHETGELNQLADDFTNLQCEGRT